MNKTDLLNFAKGGELDNRPLLIGNVSRGDNDQFVWDIQRALPEADDDLIVQIIESPEDLTFFENNREKLTTQIEHIRNLYEATGAQKIPDEDLNL